MKEASSFMNYLITIMTIIHFVEQKETNVLSIFCMFNIEKCTITMTLNLPEQCIVKKQ